jgi:hypothetical protein
MFIECPVVVPHCDRFQYVVFRESVIFLWHMYSLSVVKARRVSGENEIRSLGS